MGLCVIVMHVITQSCSVAAIVECDMATGVYGKPLSLVCFACYTIIAFGQHAWCTKYPDS